MSLCFSVRLFSLEQIARTWWTQTPRETRRCRHRMLTLASQGWLQHTTVLARPLLNLVEPVFGWHPGTKDPDFVAISRELRRRWKLPARKVEVFLASHKAAAILGGTTLGVVKHLCQATHDLHVSETFLVYRRNQPEMASLWVGEDSAVANRSDSKRPDALLRNEHGEVLRVVEFGGAYKADRVQAMHEHCLQHNHPYEIW
jgi:hypothetical protein